MSTAFTVVLRKKTPMGNGYQASFKLTGPTSYSTGGITVNAGLLFPSSGCRIIDHLIIKSVTGFVLAQWDETNSKIKLFYPTGGATAPSTVIAPSATATPASGATAVTSTAAQPAIPVVHVAGIGKELAAATDVSAVIVELLVQMR